jgi:hypothetical protein
MHNCVRDLHGKEFRKENVCSSHYFMVIFLILCLQLHVEVRSHVATGNNSNSRKRSAEEMEQAGEGNASDSKTENQTVTNKPKPTARDTVAGWWNISYEEQLRRKQLDMKKHSLIRVVQEINKAYKVQRVDKSKIPEWLGKQR